MEVFDYEGLKISVFAFCENCTYMVQIVGDHTQADPPPHSGIALIEASPETMSSLQHADAALAAGPPFLTLFEPALLLFALPLSAFGGAIRDAHALDTSLVRGSFILG